MKDPITASDEYGLTFDTKLTIRMPSEGFAAPKQYEKVGMGSSNVMRARSPFVREDGDGDRIQFNRPLGLNPMSDFPDSEPEVDVLESVTKTV